MSLDELSALVRAEAEKAGLRWVEDDTSVALGPASQRHAVTVSSLPDGAGAATSIR